MNELDLIKEDCTYEVKGTVLRLLLDLIAIYNRPCVVDDGGAIQRVDYSNRIYGLLGQLYQEMSHQNIKLIRSKND